GSSLDLALVTPDRLAVLAQDRLLALDRLEPAADVVRIRVAGYEAEGDLLTAATDQERQVSLERRRIVAHLARVIAPPGCAGLLPAEHAPDHGQRLGQPAQALGRPV